MRLFIAIDLGQAVRAVVEKEIERLRALAPNAKWVKAEGVHVTLAFLGHLEDARAEELKAIVSEVARRHPPMQLRVEGIGGFGNSARPRVLWAGLAGDIERLASIKTDLEKRVTPFGYQPETRPFKLHLTLARARMPKGDSALARCIRASEIISFGTAKVSRLILFRSDLSPKGAKYTALCAPGLIG